MDAGVEHVLCEGAARLHFYVRKYVREQYTKLGGIIQGITFRPDRRYANGSLVTYWLIVLASSSINLIRSSALSESIFSMSFLINQLITLQVIVITSHTMKMIKIVFTMLTTPTSCFIFSYLNWLFNLLLS